MLCFSIRFSGLRSLTWFGFLQCVITAPDDLNPDNIQRLNVDDHTGNIKCSNIGGTSLIFDSYSDEDQVQSRNPIINNIRKIGDSSRHFRVNFNVSVIGSAAVVLSPSTVGAYCMPDRESPGDKSTDLNQTELDRGDSPTSTSSWSPPLEEANVENYQAKESQEHDQTSKTDESVTIKQSSGGTDTTCKSTSRYVARRSVIAFEEGSRSGRVKSSGNSKLGKIVRQSGEKHPLENTSEQSAKKIRTKKTKTVSQTQSAYTALTSPSLLPQPGQRNAQVHQPVTFASALLTAPVIAPSTRLSSLDRGALFAHPPFPFAEARAQVKSPVSRSAHSTPVSSNETISVCAVEKRHMLDLSNLNQRNESVMYDNRRSDEFQAISTLSTMLAANGALRN